MICNPEGSANLELPADHYDRTLPVTDIDAHWSSLDTSRHAIWYPALALSEGGIADLGCGSGHLCQMAEDLGADYRFGVDSSHRAIGFARLRCPDATCHLADLLRSRRLLRRTDYHTAVLTEVLEHVYDDLGLLCMIPRRKVIVASVPSFWTDGHVRWFASASQVRHRYGRVLDIDAMVVARVPRSSNRWFVIRGRRLP